MTKKQDVDVVAWGQDAYFHTANTVDTIFYEGGYDLFAYHLLDCSKYWENDKPHVIYGYAIVDPDRELDN